MYYECSPPVADEYTTNFPVFTDDLCHYTAAGANVGLYGLADSDESSAAGERTYVDIRFEGDAAKLILDEEPPPGFTAYLRHYLHAQSRD